MYFRPSRLALIKFLGLWGTTQPEKKVHPTDSKNLARTPDEHNEPPIKEQLSRGNFSYTSATQSCAKKVHELMLQRGVPGLTICVSKRGEILWHSSFGYCDVENLVECDPDAKMRIASVSKSMFAASIIGPMIDENRIDLDASVHKYLSLDEFPKQKFDGKEYDITTRQLLSHTAGIKHYDGTDRNPEDVHLKSIGSKSSMKIYQSDEQFGYTESYQRTRYRNVIDAMQPFKDKPLSREPGNYGYSSYGYTVVSAVAQKVHQAKEECKDEQIEDHWVTTLKRDWKLKDSGLDQDEPILSKRAHYYLRSAFNGSLVNAPYTDNSVKWAGGGLISTSRDMVKFANLLIDSYKGREGSKLSSSTVKLLWTPVKTTYGLGFQTKSLDDGSEFADEIVVYHTGAALGASSILSIYPESEVVVAIIVNIDETNLYPLAHDVASIFNKVQLEAE